MAMRSSKLASQLSSSCVVGGDLSFSVPSPAPSVPSHPLDVQSPYGSWPLSSSSPAFPPDDDACRRAAANDDAVLMRVDVDVRAPESARSAAARNIALACSVEEKVPRDEISSTNHR